MFADRARAADWRNHYDGGWTSAGIFGYWNCPTVVWVTGSGPDEPDAAWNLKWEQATWDNHGAFMTNVIVFFCAYLAFKYVADHDLL